ncbi:MAG: NAD-dependent epimerase/dehydratase family protein [Pirellulales bacterium]
MGHGDVPICPPQFKFTGSILAGEPIDGFNNFGNHRRDFTYVEDIVEGVIRVLDQVATPNSTWSGDDPDSATSYAPYRLYNIGNNQPVELMRYIEVLENCLGKQAQKNLLPLQPGDVPDTYADVQDLVNDLGYRPDSGRAVHIEFRQEVDAILSV